MKTQWPEIPQEDNWRPLEEWRLSSHAKLPPIIPEIANDMSKGD